MNVVSTPVDARANFTYHGLPNLRINGINPNVTAAQFGALAAALSGIQSVGITDGFLTVESDLTVGN